MYWCVHRMVVVGICMEHLHKQDIRRYNTYCHYVRNITEFNNFPTINTVTVILQNQKLKIIFTKSLITMVQFALGSYIFYFQHRYKMLIIIPLAY